MRLLGAVYIFLFKWKNGATNVEPQNAQFLTNV